jgi:hypothetical protein
MLQSDGADAGCIRINDIRQKFAIIAKEQRWYFDGSVVSQAMTDGEGQRVHSLPISRNVQSPRIPG